jgi:hypothetical protein
MEAEPTPTPDPSLPAPAEMQALFKGLYLPAALKTAQMASAATRIRVVGFIMVVIAFFCVCILLDSCRGDAAKFTAILLGASGMMLGFLALAIGAYMRGCAHHHRFVAVSSILQSPHLTPAQARELLAQMERSLPAENP